MAGKNGFTRAVGTCVSCGKQNYLTRADAKSAARAVNPAEHFSPYECISGYWHFGKLSTTVARGYGSRDASREYPPAVTRSVDPLAAQRKVRERALYRNMARGIINNDKNKDMGEQS